MAAVLGDAVIPATLNNIPSSNSSSDSEFVLRSMTALPNALIEAKLIGEPHTGSVSLSLTQTLATQNRKRLLDKSTSDGLDEQDVSRPRELSPVCDGLEGAKDGDVSDN